MQQPPVPTAVPAPPPHLTPEAGLSSFLITDIEGSTRLWEEHAGAMGAALAEHDRLLRSSVEACGGTVIKTTGDGLLAVFDDPIWAISAALGGQRGLRDATWGATGPLRVRMAIHAGAAESRDGDYFGPALNRSARILAIGHGGQILVSAVIAVLGRDRLPGPASLRDLGSHRLRDLDRPEQVFQLLAPDLPAEFPPLRSLSTRRSNLPVQLTSFVGRERELAEVDSLVGRHRLVTLIGTGGTGKTRLMLEAATRLGDRFADGTWLAELAPLGDASQIASEIARALGAPEVPGQPAIATVTAFLADKELVLLLDNAEHLVDGVAGVAERLLAAAPRLRILTTSREALAVPGEAVLQLQSLSCPSLAGSHGGGSAGAGLDPALLEAAAGTEAVRLFVERASAVAPDFVLGPANVVAVSEICRRLDGIPLAIELAAARISAMSADDIALRLGDRFRLLAGGRRTAVPRQQTLHALVDWSWDLLTDDDRRLLRRLSIFAGGWTSRTAARIVGSGPDPLDEVEILDGLTRLVDRSLVVVDRGPTTRYRMLETIRQYAREKLIEAGEVATLADRHFATFAALAATAAPELRGPAMGDWLDRLDADAENLGAALEWGLEASPWQAAVMARDLLAYWQVRVASADADARTVAAIEIARARTVGVPDVPPEEQAIAATLLGDAARLWAMSGRAATGYPWAQDAIILARASGDRRATVYALGGLAISTIFTGRAGPDGGTVRPMFMEATDLAEEIGEWWIVAMAAGFNGATMMPYDPAAGEVLVRRGADGGRRSGSPFAIAAAAMGQGRMLGSLGRTDESAASFRIAVDRLTELGDERMALAARSDLAHALRRGGRLDEAMAVYRETIGGWVHLGHRGAVANQLENIAYVAVDQGDLDRAARLFGAAEALREASGSRPAFDEEPEMARYVERLRTAMPVAELDPAWSVGRSLTMAEAVGVASAG
jgi:predicted ATPase/class 3 adenylate cyclase